MVVVSGQAVYPMILQQVCGETFLNSPDSTNIILNLEREGFLQDEKEFIVGRHCDCDLQLEAKHLPSFLSREHAKLTIDRSQQVFVLDLGSMNGTFVNDVMLEPFVKTCLNISDTVTFGCCLPGVVISPGNIVTQDGAPFKFSLKQGDANTNIIADSAPHMKELHISSLPGTPFQKSFKPIESSTPCISADIKGCDSDHDSGIICIDDSSTKYTCKIKEEPKPEVKLEYSNKDTVTKDDTLPLTVKNLLAFSGCTFNNMQFSSDEKENQNIKDKSTLNQSATRNIAKAKIKRPVKRKRRSCFTKRKRTKTDTEESCASFECRLKGIKTDEPSNVVSWVQCDYCDKWYHTYCADCDYNTVKSKKRKFRCGVC